MKGQWIRNTLWAATVLTLLALPAVGRASLIVDFSVPGVLG